MVEEMTLLEDILFSHGNRCECEVIRFVEESRVL